MKWTRLAFAAVLVAVPAAFGLQVGTDEPSRVVSTPEPITTISSDPGSPAEAEGTGARASAREDPERGDTAAHEERPAETAAVTHDAPDRRDERRRRWRRGRSRYPGPIPSPADWEPPEGPVRIGLQAGHWRADEAPRELSGLRGNGTRWAGTAEWEVNLAIARRAGAQLEEMGYEVDLLPAVVPPSYRAHLFISIHADGSNDPGASGYRVAPPRRDATGRAAEMAALLERSYGDATGLPRVPTVTRRMRSYYAFNFRRYEHALHPMTIGVIIETGFLTSAKDRQVILNDPERAARGIVEAVTAFPHTPPPEVVDRP